MDSIFAVVFETAYVTKVLFQGTKRECQIFMKMNVVAGDDYTFIQELEMV